MFVTRLISGILLLIAAVFLLFQGGPMLFAASLAISLVGLFEVYRVLKIEKELPGIVGYLAVAVYYLTVWFGWMDYAFLLVIAYLMILMSIYVFTFPRYCTEHITNAFFGVFYVGIMFSYVYQIRSMTDGAILVWLILLSSWGCDTCAYCVGVLFGKHKLAPKLSPKKSIEGAVGGTVGASLLGLVFGMLMKEHMNEIVQPGLVCAGACAIGAVISQIGDLAASAIKRNHEIKDYGKLIPGHGGIMDRFDSMIYTAPAVYFAVLFMAQL